MVVESLSKIIEVKDCFYKYDDGTEALRGINFSINQGEKLAFLGANGSGKSTMFLCLNGILRPQKGQILFNGAPLNYSRKELLKLRSQVGIVFQEPDKQLFCSSVYQEISFGVLNLGLDEESTKAIVENVIGELEITPFMKKPTHFLSGGQKKQVAIADIVAMNPKLIILDEPASALDPKHTEIVRNMINKLSEKGMTVVVSTHDMNYALEWADRVIVFESGRILAEGKPEDILSDEELIIKSNLLQPEVIKLYLKLCNKGILDKNLAIPKTMDNLGRYIENVIFTP